jgi:hypothetical protein
MSDVQQLSLSDIVTVGVFVAGTIVGAVKWWTVRQDARIAALENKLTDHSREMAGKVSMETYNATLEALRRDIREQSSETRERIDKLLTILIEKK